MMATLLLPAGLTSPAALRFCREEELLRRAKDPERLYREKILPEKAKENLRYLREFSLLGDCKVLWDTLRAMVGGLCAEGAKRGSTCTPPGRRRTPHLKKAWPRHAPKAVILGKNGEGKKISASGALPPGAFPLTIQKQKRILQKYNGLDRSYRGG